MAQLSTNTIFYDQIIKKIQDFINKYKNNKNASYSEIAEEYILLITEVNKYATSQISNYEPIIKGEPPCSQKMNRFIKSVSDDLSIFAKQLDYQTGMIVSLFNMFNAEIEKESKFINRIKSKTNILNTYSNSPGTDLYYFGDSFDNLDFIDIGNSKNLPLISRRNGFSAIQIIFCLESKIDFCS
jgi:hypothetical protein